MKYGLVADSAGNADVLEAAVDRLVKGGAERIAFLGGYWTDLDEVFQRKRASLRGRPEYTDADFLSDVARFMEKREIQQKGAAQAAAAPKDEIDKFTARFVRVPDKDSLQYRNPEIPVKLPDLVGGLLGCLVHDKADLVKEDIANATLIFHGRGKEPGVVQIGPRFFVTPGRLLGASRSTYAIVERTREGTFFKAMDLSGAEIRRYKFALEPGSKVTVK